MLDLIPLRIETSPFAGRPVANLMMELVDARKLDPAKLTVDFGLDPIGDMARTGSALLPWPELSARAGATAKDVRAKGFDSAHLLRADGRAVHEAGGSEAQELAFSIASGVSYLRLLEASGFTLQQARQRIVSGGSRMPMIPDDRQISHALRKLWARESSRRADRVERSQRLSPRRQPGA
jgi:methylmalonyl-CoA mutase